MGKPYKIHKLQMSWDCAILKSKTGDGLLEKFNALCDCRLGSDFGINDENVCKLRRGVTKEIAKLKSMILDDYLPEIPFEWRDSDTFVLPSTGKGKLHDNLSAIRFIVYRTPSYFIMRAEGTFRKN